MRNPLNRKNKLTDYIYLTQEGKPLTYFEYLVWCGRHNQPVPSL